MPVQNILNRPQVAVAAVLLVLSGTVAGMILAGRAGDEKQFLCFVKFATVKEGCLFFRPTEREAEGENKPLVEIRCKTRQEAFLLNAILLESQSSSPEMIPNAADQRFALLGKTEIQPMRIAIRTTIAGKDSYEVQYYTITRVEMLTEDTQEGEGER